MKVNETYDFREKYNSKAPEKELRKKYNSRTCNVSGGIEENFAHREADMQADKAISDQDVSTK